MNSFLTFLLMLLVLGCSSTSTTTQSPAKVDLSSIRLPDGFGIEVAARGIENARSLSLSPSGILYVGTRSKGSVYALKDADGNGDFEKQYVLATDWRFPNGVAFKDGDLYVAEFNQIHVFEDVEDNLEKPVSRVINNDYPSKTHHGWKYIAFGPDGKLYVPVGAPCNICESDDKIFSTITRIDADGSNREIVQKGIRNTVGFTWHPVTGDLWFTDNGRDWMGDDLPACELNRAAEDNMHFGYPYCHQGDLPDPKFGKKRRCDEFTPPVQNLGPHTAPLGCEFITHSSWPEKYQGAILIAEHGSWNRSTPIGYRVTMVRLDENGNSLGYEVFADGWLSKDGITSGRPVDLEWMPDGSLLLSDDYADMVYRIYVEK